ncbi:unnamed protein product [Prunus armeniaca]|uniref:Uncharacterized protein n=2 Tax=Prunus armeniaca TaxID=36596 RepID=A0A6J5USY7_PRUAR|nr:unnamed protein product [Prunus armeniaca]
MGLGLFFPIPRRSSPTSIKGNAGQDQIPTHAETATNSWAESFPSLSLSSLLSLVVVGNMMSKRCRLSSIPGNHHDHERVMKEYQAMKDEIKARALKEEWDLLIKDYNVCVSAGLIQLQYALQKLFRVRDGIITTLSPANLDCVFGPMDDASIVRLVEGLGEVSV